MANKPKSRRRRGRYLKGSVDEQLDLSTLAPATLISVDFDEAVNERTLISSIVYDASMKGFTPATDVGPIMVGVAHGDYSDPEIEAVIENLGSWNEGNKISQEISKRLVRILGIFPSPSSALDSVNLNDGLTKKAKLNWILLQGQSLTYWAYNLGQAAVATTDPRLQLSGHANLWPR